MVQAPGGPGLDPTWASSDKDAVITALGTSRVWATVGHGIVNEVYWPTTGEPQLRDLGFLVVDRHGWVEVKRFVDYTITTPAPDIPLVSVCHRTKQWRLELTFVVDPTRDTVLISYDLGATDADAGPLELYVLAAPHLGGGAAGPNTAWRDDEVLYAVGGQAACCLAATPALERTSVGFVGESDGWQDLDRHGTMTWQYDRADAGNVALMGRLVAPRGVVALGLGANVSGARTAARASLADGFESIARRFVADWERWTDTVVLVPHPRADVAAQLRRSLAVLRCHEDRAYPGAMIASLSVPWGNTRSDLGGYHLVWTRDCVESALALLVTGQVEACRRVLTWLVATQQPDGHWTQNAFPDGQAYWTGIQLDEVALPVILATRLAELGHHDVEGATTMVRRAVGYLAAHGPSSPQDRWEENPGVSPFTIATVVAALYGASRWLDGADATYALSLARYWDARIEDWTFVSRTELDDRYGTRGHYVRLGRAGSGHLCGRVDIANRAGMSRPVETLVGGDFLALVRLGLRRADDARIVDSVTVLDGELRAELPTGVAYYRYSGDGYGEHADGSGFDGTGLGRPWPLLAGERGLYAAQAGQDASRYVESMMAMTGRGGLFPEQVWDGPEVAERGLWPGHPTGSAMPLVWAHGEFVKLATLAPAGRPIETLEAVVDQRHADATWWHWRADVTFDAVAPGVGVVIDLDAAAVIEHGSRHERTDPIGLGRWGVHLGPQDPLGRYEVVFEDPRRERLIIDLARSA